MNEEREDYHHSMLHTYKVPNLKEFIDEDILKIFDDSNVFYSDIINAQLIKTLRELTIELRKS